MTEEHRPLVACLFVPGDKPRAIEKAAGLGADALILDLEDAVGEPAKETARAATADAIASWAGSGARRVLRTAPPEDDAFSLDAETAADAQPDAVLLAKLEDAAALRRARALLDEAGYGGPLWAMIETPRALLSLPGIVEAAQGCGLAALVAGTNDLASLLRLPPQDAARSGLTPHLAALVAAARAAGLAAIDGVRNDFSDPSGVETEARAGRALGFDGKTLIHPAQLAPARAGFAPGPDELAQAREIAAAFEAPENAGKGAVNVGGRMAEAMHYAAAKAVLARADG